VEKSFMNLKELEYEMRTLKFAGWLLVLAVAVGLSAGAARAEEKKLTMYVAYGGPEIIAQQFEAATGIKVEYLTMSSGEVLTRLRAEKANPGADVWFGGGSDAFIQAKKEGLTAPFKAPNASRVSKAFKDPDGYWTGVSLVVVGFLANTDRLTGKGLALPMTWEALASPDYRDEVSASNLNTSGTAYTTVSGVLQMKGEKAGWPFLEKLYANIPFLTKSGSAPGKMALSGEFSVGIAPDPHILANKNPDAPLAVVYPSDGVLAWPSPVSIIANAKHPENAKKFVDWCLSPEGQKVLMQASPRVPTTDVEPLPGVPKLSDLKLVAYDILRWGNERERVVAEFNKLFPKYQ
jgi:iron(III) transport system substrate-binding protein